MSKISVIVPIYNVEPYIHQCVDSIINQTYKDLEIILVDDGSPDNCGKICDEYAAKDSRVKVIHRPNGGLSAARNSGLDVATGDYILFVDSDDYIVPELAETCINELEKTNSDILVFDAYLLKQDGLHQMGLDGTYFSSTEKAKEAILRDDTPCYVWNKIYKAKLWKNIRFTPNVTFEDLLVMPEVFEYITGVSFINKPLYVYNCTNNTSITNNLSSKSKFGLYLAFKNRQTIAKDMGLQEFIPYCRHRAIRSAVGGIGFDLARPALEKWQVDDIYTYLEWEEKATDRPKIGLKYEILLWAALHAKGISKFYGRTMFFIENVKKLIHS